MMPLLIKDSRNAAVFLFSGSVLWLAFVLIFSPRYLRFPILYPGFVIVAFWAARALAIGQQHHWMRKTWRVFWILSVAWHALWVVGAAFFGFINSFYDHYIFGLVHFTWAITAFGCSVLGLLSDFEH
jgi:hypothetical protein